MVRKWEDFGKSQLYLPVGPAQEAAAAVSLCVLIGGQGSALGKKFVVLSLALRLEITAFWCHCGNSGICPRAQVSCLQLWDGQYGEQLCPQLSCSRHHGGASCRRRGETKVPSDGQAATWTWEGASTWGRPYLSFHPDLTGARGCPMTLRFCISSLLLCLGVPFSPALQLHRDLRTHMLVHMDTSLLPLSDCPIPGELLAMACPLQGIPSCVTGTCTAGMMLARAPSDGLLKWHCSPVPSGGCAPRCRWAQSQWEGQGLRVRTQCHGCMCMHVLCVHVCAHLCSVTPGRHWAQCGHVGVW